MIWTLLIIYFAIGFLLSVFVFSFDFGVDCLEKVLKECGIEPTNANMRFYMFIVCVLTGILWGPKLIKLLLFGK